MFWASFTVRLILKGISRNGFGLRVSGELAQD